MLQRAYFMGVHCLGNWPKNGALIRNWGQRADDVPTTERMHLVWFFVRFLTGRERPGGVAGWEPGCLVGVGAK